MLQIDPNEYNSQNLFRILQGGIAPRPIAFASTVDNKGNHNLAPFSFYNIFGINPTTLIFSPSRRGRDNTTKHTLDNLKEVPEVVINAVTFDMVQQMSLASTEYEKGVDEFIKSGFTPLESKNIKPRRVAESPIQFECRVREIIETSGKPGSGNLVICEIVYIHVDEKIFDENGEIDPDKLDLVGRMGGDYYVRTSGNAKFIVPKPLTTLGIGVDALPDHIRLSNYLTGNDLGQLGNLEKLPSESEIKLFRANTDVKSFSADTQKLHEYAHNLIAANKVTEALIILMTRV
ncbi:MAG: flavin reductase family protein [Bacteroidetes bacterium]|nr:flavin reductase family protein [Bacteroidota bacterium]